jgi:hypothetical protein
MLHPHPEEFICPISYELMSNPVILEDGYTYDESSINKALKMRQISPMTGLPISNKVIPNRTLKNIIDKYCLSNNIILPKINETNNEINKYDYIISINDIIYNNKSSDIHIDIDVSFDDTDDNDSCISDITSYS